ncbi:MAG: hypothetical protein H7Z37_14125 [Pyrinomonadaceae bacterium]|nr:hypothetical protein [Pyrinomonadaceae bacterium]
MNETTHESQLLSYFLGELSANENERIESACFDNDDFASQLLFAEEDLIKLYLGEELKAQQKIHFEQNYLTSDARRERVELCKLLKLKSSNRVNGGDLPNESLKPLLVKTPNPVKFPFLPENLTPRVFATGLFASLLLTIGFFGAAGIVFYSNRTEPETAQNKTFDNDEQSPSTSQTFQSDSTNPFPKNDISANDSQQPKNVNKTPSKKNLPKQAAAVEKLNEDKTDKNYNFSIPSKSASADNNKQRFRSPVNRFTLFGGASRDQSVTEQVVSLDDSNRTTDLSLVLPETPKSGDKNLRAELQNAEGAVLQVQTDLKITTNKEKKIVSISFPTSLFEEKQYVLSLAENENTSITDYVFRVKKKVGATSE